MNISSSADAGGFGLFLFTVIELDKIWDSVVSNWISYRMPTCQLSVFIITNLDIA